MAFRDTLQKDKINSLDNILAYEVIRLILVMKSIASMNELARIEKKYTYVH